MMRIRKTVCLATGNKRVNLCYKRPGGFYLSICCSIFIFLLPGITVWAQQEDNVWIFGDSARVDFNSGVPVASALPAWYDYHEGCASISDETGQLILYTNGSTVYGKNYLPLPNGTGMIPTSPISTTQATVIAPIPGRPGQYYIFSLESAGYAGRLYYSVVDMSLNSGIGDVLPAQKMVQLDSNLTEKMTITATCDRVWLMVRSRSLNEYKAYSITASGLNTTPVISTIGNGIPDNYLIGTIRFSPDGSKMVAPLFGFLVNDPLLELYDFDNTTGLLSNARVLDRIVPLGTGFYYATAFSPDNSKLYAGFGPLRQFDLSQPTLAGIIASKTEIASLGVFGDIRLGPDGKLYVAKAGFPYLHCIKSPNQAGLACDFVADALALPAGNVSLGLPNAVVFLNALFKDTVNYTHDTATCLAFRLECPAPGVSCLWNTGARDSFINVTAPGIYWVRYISDCIRYTHTYQVSFIDPPVIDLGKDTVYCAGAPFSMDIKAAVPAGYKLRWSTGATQPQITVTRPGLYWLSAVQGDCVASDSIRIREETCDCTFNIPSAFSPNGDGLNDIFIPVIGTDCPPLSDYVMNIYNRWGQRVFHSRQPGKGWDGYYNGELSTMGAYMYEVQYTIFGTRFKRKGDITLLH